MTVAVCFLSADAAYSASFGDMFNGKKAQEYKIILEEKEQECRAKLNQKDQQYQQLVEDGRDSQGDMESLRGKNATLMEAYEKLKTDQDTITEQLNRLRRDSQRCDAVKASFEEMTEENTAFLEEKESLIKKRETLSVTLEHLKSHVKEVTAEKDRLAVFLAEAQEDESVKIKKIRDSVRDEVKNLRNETVSLKEENTALVQQLRESQKESGLFKVDNAGLRQELTLVQEELGALEKKHGEIKNENRYLAQEASQFPKKFADLARHNRKLVKETADMHYNLGVSFIKSKEYKRAVKEFEKVLELKPQDAYSNYNLGYIYAEHLVDRPTAIKHFQTYLAYASDARDADWVRKYILTWQTWYGKQQMK